MDLYDWLLFLHVLSAFLAVGALTALWALVLSTRGATPSLSPDSAMRFGRAGGILVGVGMVGVVVFGIWLAIRIDGYELWDPWILASIVIWALSGWAGGQAGRAFAKDPIGGRRAGIRFQALNSVGLFVILVLMIWKPGA
ncbi:MAG: putative integral rane protein [Gaiellaceae bacterium]|nr:putative integral rane protein [Gaiellaceae bacterium]